ncbi:MAG TPA: hypothetical protein VF988_06950, partial [Verrucomicrobiae bacterium]
MTTDYPDFTDIPFRILSVVSVQSVVHFFHAFFPFQQRDDFAQSSSHSGALAERPIRPTWSSVDKTLTDSTSTPGQ